MNATDEQTGVKPMIVLAADSAYETLGEADGHSKDSILSTALVQYRYPSGADGKTSVELALNPALLREAFAADLPPELTALMAVTQRPIATAAFSEVSGPPAWRKLPSWTVVATGDKAAGADVILPAARAVADTHR